MADQNCEDIAVNFYRNTYGIQCLMSDGRMTSSNLLMISGQIGFMTRHAAFLWRKKGIVPVELIVDFASKGSSFGKVHSRAFKFVDFENNYGDGFRDIIGVVIPEAPLSLDLKHHLRESPLEHKIQQPMRVERRRDGTLNTTTGIAIYRDDDAIVCPPALPDAEGVTLEDVLIAEGMDHENGHCGYAVLCKNPAMEKKFMGIHVGGTNEGSLIEEITLSMFNQCVQKLGKSECFAEIGFGNPFKYSISKTYFKEEPLEDKYIGYRSIGTIDPPVMTPNKTSLEATIVNKGCIFEGKRLDPPYEIREAPALLGLKRLPDGKIIDPYTLSLRKLASKLFLPQIELLFDPAVWKGIFKEKLKHYDFTPLTVKEAFCGTRDARNIPGIDRSTSATFPLSSWGWSREDLYRPEIKDAQGNIIQEFWVHEELLAHINYIIAEMEAGRIDPHFVISCLKDERRTLDRVEAGYTRMFKIGQLARLIITRMYILPFMIAVEHSQCTDIMVGCNPTSSDWKRIYDMMCKFSGAKYIVAQDVSGWDLHYYQPIIRAFCIHYADFFGLKYELMKHLYMILIANICVYVVLRGLIALSSEMPSGVFITSFFNSVLNSVKHRICFLVQCLRKLGHALDFDEYNFLRVFGDDSIMAILEAIINMWNGIIFAKLAKEIFNHDHTSSSKGDLKPYEPLNEVFFLQRQFLPHEGLVLAPLNRITLEGMVQYIMKSKNETHAEIFKTVCHNALDEWALYGPNEFDKHKGILNAFLRYYKKDYSYNYKWEDVIAVWARRVETKA